MCDGGMLGSILWLVVVTMMVVERWQWRRRRRR